MSHSSEHCFKRLISKKRNQEEGQSFLIVAVNMAQTPLLKYKKVQITMFPSCRHIEIKTIKDFPYKTAKQNSLLRRICCWVNLSPELQKIQTNKGLGWILTVSAHCRMSITRKSISNHQRSHIMLQNPCNSSHDPC